MMMITKGLEKPIGRKLVKPQKTGKNVITYLRSFFELHFVLYLILKFICLCTVNPTVKYVDLFKFKKKSILFAKLNNEK